MKRKLLYLACFVLCAVSTTAYAASCRSPSPEQQLELADVVFEGTVIERDRLDEPIPLCQMCEEKPQCGAKIATFDVQSITKGDVPQQVRIYSSDACAGFGNYFRYGQTYLVYANKPNADVPDGVHYQGGFACGGTKMLD